MEAIFLMPSDVFKLYAGVSNTVIVFTKIVEKEYPNPIDLLGNILATKSQIAVTI